MALQAVPALEQHHRPPRQIGACNRGHVGQRMPPRTGQHVAVLEQGLAGQITDIEWQRDDRRVEPPVLQPVDQRLRQILAQIQPQLREIPAQMRHDLWDQIRPDRRDHPEPQIARKRRAARPGQIDHVLGLAQDAPRPRHDLVSRGGDDHLPLGALGHGHAEIASSSCTPLLSADWLTWQRSAARPKCNSSARATR